MDETLSLTTTLRRSKPYSAAENSPTGKPQGKPKAGQYWLILREGRHAWPGLICDDDMVTTLLKGDRLPNAMIQGGTWPENLIVEKIFPVLCLGSLEL